MPRTSRQARHHARPRRRNHARDDGRARAHQRLRRGEQLPACRQGTPPGHRGTARLPVPAIGQSDCDPHPHRPGGTPDRQTPGRGGTAQEDPAGTGYRNTDGPGHRPVAIKYDARDLHDLFRRSHLPSRDGQGSSAMFRRTRPADPFCCGWSGSAPVSGAAPRSDR